MRVRKKAPILTTLAVVAAMSASVYAFTASNTVNTPPKVGDGSSTISGYTISSVSYTLNSTNPANIDSVALTTSAAATTVKIKLVSSGSTWYSCSTSNSPTNTTWSCTTTSPQASVATADELRVVAQE